MTCLSKMIGPESVVRGAAEAICVGIALDDLPAAPIVKDYVTRNSHHSIEAAICRATNPKLPMFINGMNNGFENIEQV